MAKLVGLHGLRAFLFCVPHLHQGARILAAAYPITSDHHFHRVTVSSTEISLEPHHNESMDKYITISPNESLTVPIYHHISIYQGFKATVQALPRTPEIHPATRRTAWQRWRPTCCWPRRRRASLKTSWQRRLRSRAKRRYNDVFQRGSLP